MASRPAEQYNTAVIGYRLAYRHTGRAEAAVRVPGAARRGGGAARLPAIDLAARSARANRRGTPRTAHRTLNL